MNEQTYNIAECGSKTLPISSEYNNLTVKYVVVGDYKVVTLYYNRLTSMTLQNGTTYDILTNPIPSQFRPPNNMQVPYAKCNVILGSNGNISFYNGTGSSLPDYNPYGTFTYIVTNRQI